MSIKDFVFSSREYFEDFITRSTYHSNAIEGNTLSYAETYAILFNDNTLKVKASPREFYEAINHKYALNYVLKNLDSDLNEKMIITICKHINKNISEAAGYRTVPVRIRGAEHIPPSPELVNQKMMYFVYNYNHTQYDNVFEKIATTHIEFERIHPFEDGNGRTGRLLINYELLRNDLAPVVIPKDDRVEYMKLLADGNVPDLSMFLSKLSDNEMERLETLGYESYREDHSEQRK